jgi:hypothetical protein
MKYTVSLSSDRKFIVVYIDGPMTTELAVIVGKEANALALENNITSLFYDLRNSRNIQNGFKNYEFGYKDAEAIGFNKSFKIAVLTDPADRSHDLIETVMVNNGYNVKIFNVEKDAVNWLIT